ncbi:MAG: penicillin acylase family protein, partial [Leptospirales bacterium]|nr:penicillin acylase family protein [Leptospirales bacterium]
ISSRYFNWNRIANLSNMALPASRYAIIGNNITHMLPQVLKEHSFASAKWLKRFEELVQETSGGAQISPDSLKKILNDTYTPDCQKFIPIFIKNLETNPIPSSRLSRIYFSKWDYHSESDSVAASLFHSVLLDYISETFAGKTAFDLNDIVDNHQLLTDNFHKMILERSVYFNDRRTNFHESAEDIFDRAFLKTLRKLNRSEGPLMDQWSWGNIHRNAYRFPLKTAWPATLKSEWKKDNALSGGIGSILGGDVGADLRPKYASSVKGIFTSSVSEIIMDFPCSFHPKAPFDKKNISSEFGRRQEKYVTIINKR